MINRNKGDTQDLEKSVLIPADEVNQFRESIIRVLELVKLEKCNRVQLGHIKKMYKLLESLAEKD